SAGYGRLTLLPLLLGALLRRAAPVRGPARRLHRPLPPEGRGPALRLRLRRLPPTRGPVPGRLRRRTAAPLFGAPRPGRPPGPPPTSRARPGTPGPGRPPRPLPAPRAAPADPGRRPLPLPAFAGPAPLR